MSLGIEEPYLVFVAEFDPEPVGVGEEPPVVGLWSGSDEFQLLFS